MVSQGISVPNTSGNVVARVKALGAKAPGVKRLFGCGVRAPGVVFLYSYALWNR